MQGRRKARSQGERGGDGKRHRSVHRRRLQAAQEVVGKEENVSDA